MIRIASPADISGIVKIYDKILDLEVEGKGSTGWKKGIYPTKETALEALESGELFVLEEDGIIYAAARINQRQESEYASCNWEFDVPDSEVMVLHTLVVDPDTAGRGFGSSFVRFYEEYALKNNCHYLRMDTNVNNAPARKLYKKLGYSEPGVISCFFNGIDGVPLVCLEKRI